MRSPAARTLATAVLLSAGLVPWPASATAAATPTCNGLPATLVGPGGLVGTPGDDVVVTEGAYSVRTGEGEDQVCVTGTSETGVSIDVGAGDDTITVVGSATHQVYAYLGAGDDTFLGLGEWDQVSEGGLDGVVPAISGRDRITTGSGRDDVTLGVPGEPVRDQVAMGWGGDELVVTQPVATGFSALGGPDQDSVTGWAGEGGGWRVDNVRERLVSAGEEFVLDGFETFDLPMPGTAFRGGDAAEQVRLDAPGGPITLGDGDDVLALAVLPDPVTAGTTPVAGGEGSDRLTVGRLDASAATADLRTGRITDDTGALAPFAFTRFERLAVSGRDRLTLRGGPQDDVLRGSACLVRGNGRRGDDLLVAFQDVDVITCPVVADLVGGPGRDRLFGAEGPLGGDDRLIGGRGFDRATGWAGRDLCRAEVRRVCERR